MIELIPLLKQLGAIGAALGSVYAGWKWLWKPARKKLLEQKKFKESCLVIAKEMQPNGGGSMRDSIEGLKHSMDSVLTTVIRLDQRQISFANQSETAIYETDGLGDRIFVNRAYCRLTGRTPDEVLGKGWKIVICPEDRERVIEEWDTCVKERRDFDMTYTIVNTRGERIKVHNHGYVLKDIRGFPIGYMGFITRSPQN